jgi:hypothetical protein
MHPSVTEELRGVTPVSARWRTPRDRMGGTSLLVRTPGHPHRMETPDENLDPTDPSYGMPDADKGPEEGENPSGPIGEIQREEDTRGGPEASIPGEDAGEDA